VKKEAWGNNSLKRKGEKCSELRWSERKMAGGIPDSFIRQNHKKKKEEKVTKCSPCG